MGNDTYYREVGRPLVIGIFIVIIICLGEPDLLDAVIKFIMSKSV